MTTFTATLPLPLPDGAATARVALLGLSPRVGLSYLGCQSAARILESAGITATFASTVDMPLVAVGLDEEPGVAAAPHVAHLRAVLDSADAVVIGVPVHRSAVAGAARNWVELLRTGIEGKPVLPIVAAGSSRAHLAAVHFQADLYLNFGANALPPVVITPEQPFEETEQRLASATGRLVSALAQPAPIGIGS